MTLFAITVEQALVLCLFFKRLYASVTLAITCLILRNVSRNCPMPSVLAAEIAYKLIKLNITSYLATLTKVKAASFLPIDDAYINDSTI